MAHKWKPEDDLVALYFHKCGGKGLGHSVDEMGKKLGMGGAAMRMRIGNFKAIDGGGGLGNYARQSKQVYDANNGLTPEDIRSRALRHPRLGGRP